MPLRISKFTVKYNLKITLSYFRIILVINFVFVIVTYFIFLYCIHAIPSPIQNLHYIKDPNLSAKIVFTGLKFPTSMAFLGPNDILVLEKDKGTVNRIINGTMLSEPLIKVPIANDGERGMLGIAVTKNKEHTFVFLYYTQSGGGKTGDVVSPGIEPLGNRLYKYELINNKLVNPKLLLDIPAASVKLPNDHVGGKLLIGLDQNIYLIVGNIGDHQTITQNFPSIHPPIGSVIYRISQNGDAVGSILGNSDPINKIYAYGIRNSFGMDFDPITGNLWDTENGPNYGDEINLVQPGFNSGWAQVQGIWKPNGEEIGPTVSNPSSGLVDFGGKGKYRLPEFIWKETIGPTAIKFLNSTKLGKQYKNDIFVGDVDYGNIYHFKLNQNRTGLVIDGILSNKIANRSQDSKSIIFARGLDPIVDMQVGPDGYLYVLSLGHGDFEKQENKQTNGGTIYKIGPKSP
jgi:aldose sugar dehydrogenase